MKKDTNQPSVLLYDDVRKRKNYVEIGDDSIRHWVGYLRSNNPNDPKLDNEMVKSLSKEDLEHYFAPLHFLGWLVYSKGQYIVSRLKKHSSGECIFYTDNLNDFKKAQFGHEWLFDDFKKILGTTSKNHSKINKLVDIHEASIAATPEARAQAEKMFKNFPIDAEKIEIIDMGRASKNAERKRLKVLPKSIGKYKNLKTLTIQNHLFTSLPKEIGNLTNLEALDLNGNALESLPPEIGKLHKLQYLDLGWSNRLTTLPPEIGKLKNLITLSLNSSYSLKSLPKSIKNCKKLKTLDINESGENVKEIAKMVKKYLPKCKVKARPL